MKESDIQAKIIKYLKKQNCKVFNISDRFTSGVPDLLICVPKIIAGQRVGIFAGIEIKKDESIEPEPIQLWQLDQIRQAYGIAAVCRSVEEVEKLLAGRRKKGQKRKWSNSTGTLKRRSRN